MEDAVRIDGLSFTYHTAKEKALDNIGLQVRKGEFLVLTGPTGAGKSTLCKCISGLIPNVIVGTLEGDVEVAGMSIKDHKIYELSKKVGLVFEHPDAQLFALTVEDEIAFGPENLGLPVDEINRRIDWAFKVTRLERYRNSTPFNLSGGEKQSVVIAAILAMQPEVLVLDEPTSQLDPIGTSIIFDALRNLNRELKMTVILVEQKIEKAISIADRLILMDNGRILLDGNIKELANKNFDLLMSKGVNLPIAEAFHKLKNKANLDFEIPVTLDEGAKTLSSLLKM